MPGTVRVQGAGKRAGLTEELNILVPTEMERSILANLLPRTIRLHLVGFGAVSAGIEAARLFASFPASDCTKRIVLTGIAGTYHPSLYPPGTATCFREVAMWGIGAGPEDEFVMPGDEGMEGVSFDDRIPGSEPIPLKIVGGHSSARLLLTATSAAGTANQVSIRRTRFPQAACEDMEGYPVALAARRAGKDLTILRGISNIAGDRNKSRWVICDALAAVAEIINQLRDGQHPW